MYQSAPSTPFKRALCTVVPAVRMMVISVDPDGTSECFPVMFIESRFGEQAHRDGRFYPEHHPVIFFDDSTGFMTVSDLREVSPPETAIEQIVCPWPPEEDDARFRPIIDRLKILSSYLLESAKSRGEETKFHPHNPYRG